MSTTDFTTCDLFDADETLQSCSLQFQDLGGRARFTGPIRTIRCYRDNGLVKEDIMKAAVMLVAVFVFVFLGLEHSVANSVLFLIVGFQEGIDVGPALGNVGIALLGNYIGGGLLIGIYYAYVNDKARHLRKLSGTTA